MKASPRQKRCALLVGSILLFGCGSPFQILLHNELPQDADFTIRWKDDPKTSRDTDAFVPSGGAKDVSLGWGGPPDQIDVTWRTVGGVTGKRLGLPLPPNTVHAFVDGKGVRFEPRNKWDDLKDLLRVFAPLFTCFAVVTLIPMGIYLLVRRRRSA